MAERRVLLGTGAVVLGMGGALLSGTAAAHADTTDADGAEAGPAAQSSSAASPSHRGAARTRPAAQNATTAEADPQKDGPETAAPASAAPTGPPARARQSRAAVSIDRARPSSDTAPAAAVAAPSSALPVEPVPAPAPEPAVAVHTATVPTPEVVTTVRGRLIQSVARISGAASAPVAAAADPAADPAAAPVTALLDTAIAALGWGPGGGAVIGAPALAAFTGQRAGAAATAVTGTAAVAAGAPPDPTAEGAAVADPETVAETVTAAVTAAAAALADPLLPNDPNGVTGVQTGHSRLAIPGAFFGDTVAADWYFPTQADGTIDALGVIWLQHGFGASNTFYSALATDLAQRTNSIVVAPTLSSIPFTLSGGCLICDTTQQAAAAAFLDPNRTTLIDSALAAGYTGDVEELKGRFVLTGHSAGGGFASAVAADYIGEGSTEQDANLVGVVMFDGVSNGAFGGGFAEEVALLAAADKPIYQIAAPAQSWNAFGATTNVLSAARSGEFVGVVMQDGSHVDSMLGVNPLFDLVLQLVTQRVPAGNTAGVYTLSSGWINDMYAGATPEAPQYGLYAASNQQIAMGPTFAYGLPSVVANQMGLIDSVVYSVIDAIGGLIGFQLPTQVNTGDNGLNPATPVTRVGNGVSGVRSGSAVLEIPCGDDNFYAAPANWYFPTQADGTIEANGVIWLQHGFLGFNDWYSDMAQALAHETNSIVVAPNIFWFDTPFCPGCYLSSPLIREGAASMFLDGREQLNNSARLTGIFQGTLPETFVLTGHSAGGNFATGVGALVTETAAVDDLLGVVMFDGVSRAPLFTDSLAALDATQIPDYQIAAPPQQWNAWDVATELMVATYPDRFNGLQIINGSHTDVIEGDSLFADLAEILSDIIVKPSPPGGKAAVRTLATGWVNDIYAGNTTYRTNPAAPLYGVYGPNGEGPQDYSGGNQFIAMGQATAATLPAPPPVVIDAALPPDQTYLGTWYEQGSVPQFFSIGLVNTTATYSLNPDGSVKVENSGNYFFNNGPQSSITGSAVPVNAFNTRLNVGFFFGEPSDSEPGNYWILDYAPDYSWAIVSDPNLFSGYILTRDKIIDAAAYDALLDRAQLLGIRGPILRTSQFPATDPAAGVQLPGPAELPTAVTV